MTTSDETLTTEGTPMTQSPYRLTVTTADLAEHPASVTAYTGRRSLKHIPGASFHEASSFARQVCVDIHGDHPFGIYRVHNVAIKGDAAILFTSTGELLAEQNAGLLTNDELLKQIALSNTSSNISPCEYDQVISLVSTCTDCFWHWMMDSLPKVFLAEESGYTGFYLIPHRNAPACVQESVELLGIARARLILHESSPYVARTLAVPTYFSGFNAPINAHFIRKYREWIRSNLVSNGSPSDRRIYVARKPTAKARRIINHADVEHLTQQYGYRTVYFETLSLREQLTLAAGSVAMVAPHGSGMTHTLFMEEGSSIIELFPFNRAGSVDCYERLAPLLNHSYASLNSVTDQGTDIEVDINALKNALKINQEEQ